MALDSEKLGLFRDFLVARAGGYLRNPIREPLVTCGVCATPVDGYQRCYRCNEHHREHGNDLADLVAPVTYAIAGNQAAYVMRGYKAGRPVPEHIRIVSAMTWVALTEHAACAGTLTSRPVTHWGTVPSLPLKPGDHIFRRIVATSPPVPNEVVLTAATRVASPRAAKLGHFTAVVPSGSHVLLLDDTWTEGGHAQSAALALRDAGAATVSVMVVARWINPEFGSNSTFIRERLTNNYDPEICPWTCGVPKVCVGPLRHDHVPCRCDCST